MKLIKQDFNIVNQQGFSIKDIKKHIEYCARISYKSQDKITDDSYEKFVNMLEKRDHARPLEFGTVHLKMTSLDFQKFIHSLLTVGMINNIWLNHYHSYNEDTVYITTNYRYYLDIVKCFPNVKEYFTDEDNKYYPKRYTVHFIISRGIMDEFRTHVGLSHLAESTRYCNYSKDKFGKELTFIKPSWLKFQGEQILSSEDNVDHDRYIAEIDDDGTLSDFLAPLLRAEKRYNALMDKGWTPQQAREILPLAVKSELISCGFEDAWNNFFYRRCANDAHPMAREIAIPLQKRFKELGYDNQ